MAEDTCPGCSQELRALTDQATVPVASIKLHRAEGPHELLRNGLGEAHMASFREADRVLSGWGYSAPKEGGYDKVDFTVTWADGNTYKGRYDLHYPGRPNDEGRTYPDLAKHIRDFVTFSTGMAKPHWMSEKDYRAVLARDPTWAQEAVRFLQTYRIADRPIHPTMVPAEGGMESFGYGGDA